MVYSQFKGGAGGWDFHLLMLVSLSGYSGSDE